jgi:hypothetical protein
MKKTLLVLLSCVALSACGGRTSHPVATTTPDDALMSCAHLDAELAINKHHIDDLMDEKDHSENNNLAAGLLMPIYMIDLSDTERKEMDALQKRNDVLTSLMKQKNC